MGGIRVPQSLATSAAGGSVSTTQIQADIVSDQENVLSDTMQPQHWGSADRKAGTDSMVSDSHVIQLLAGSTQPGSGSMSEQAAFGPAAGPCTDAAGQGPPQERAMQALSSAEEAVALGVFSETRLEAYRKHASAQSCEVQPDGRNCMDAVSSPSGSSGHSVSCAGMGGHGVANDDAANHEGCVEVEWERDNAWMDEYRRCAVSRCVSRTPVLRCALAMEAVQTLHKYVNNYNTYSMQYLIAQRKAAVAEYPATLVRS